IRPAFFLAVCLAASTTIALADQPCGPITNVVPTGTRTTYSAYPCGPFNAGLDSQLRCANCPTSQAYQPLRSDQPVCLRPEYQPSYVLVTIERHLVNGKCVPIAAALNRKRAVPKQAPVLAGPVAPAAPPRIAPVQAPAALHAPPAVRAPIVRAPLNIAPVRVNIPHISTAPSRPQPTKPI